MKLNVGCGQRKFDGFLNVDKYQACKPDKVMDAEAFPWPFEDNSMDEVAFIHSLEHMGASADVFLKIFQELYRVCRNGAQVHIWVPHPRHDDFIGDPTHVRAITPPTLALFSKANCRQWESDGNANTPLALYLDIDFELRTQEMILAQLYADRMNAGELTAEEALELARVQNNVAQEYRMIIEAIKPGAPQASVERAG